MTPRIRVDLEDIGALDSMDAPETKYWEAKQLELVSSVVDYNLSTIANLVEQQTISLSPEYQRRTRWGPKKQSQLIESFLMNVPVPLVYLNEDRYGQYSVIDGKQRLQTIHSFLGNELRLRDLEVFSDINGKRFDELPEDLQTVLSTRPTLRAVIILRQSSPDIKHEVFWRLNTGGVNLNAQEIRNSAFSGPLNDLIMELATDERFHKMLRIRNKNTSAIYQEMRDAEFVLRFLTFRDSWKEFPGGIQRQLDNYMEDHLHSDDAFLEKAEIDFNSTLETVEEIFGDLAFRRWDPKREHWRDQVLAALIDSQMLACYGLENVDWNSAQNIFFDDYQAMFEDLDFHKSIDAATNTPALLKNRISMTIDLLDQHLA